MDERIEDFLEAARGAGYAEADLGRMAQAAEWARARLEGMLRASGEPAWTHDLRVGRILVDLGMDATSVIAGLLHDALEPAGALSESHNASDGAARQGGGAEAAAGHSAAAGGHAAAAGSQVAAAGHSGEAAAAAKAEQHEAPQHKPKKSHLVLASGGPEARELTERFGAEVADIVEGVSRLSALKARNKTVQAAETIRKMLFAMTKDIRVIIVKLADKLDNMRTLKYLDEERQKDIAAECLDIFAPLADRLGVSWMKDEFEDLSLKALNREAFDQIKSIVSAKKGERETYLARVEAAIRDAAKAEGLPVEISARAKHFYSIYQKMRKRGKGAEELYDLLGVRLICESDNDCYTLLGVVHRLWKPIEGRFKDYIAMPKANGYRSLHTTVMCFDGRLLEVQIRTHDMHRVAEYGVASHWLYKKGSTTEVPDAAALPIVNRLKEWSGFLDKGAEYLEEIKRELLGDSIFVFTPRGDVVQLPAGAGPLDFAYAIHTDVGSRCMGAKADGQIIPLDGELHNTQVVEILTSPQAHPTMNWLPLAKTSKARQKIKAALVASGEVIAIERNIVAGKRAASPKAAQKAAQQEQAEERKAREEREAEERRQAEARAHGAAPSAPVAETVYRRVEPGEAMRNEKAGVAIGGARNMMIRIAGCCRPVTGDAIVGYVSRGRGIIVHRADCHTLAAIPDFAERRIEVGWDSGASLITARFRIHAKRSTGLFSEIEQAVRKFSGHLREGRLGEQGDGSLSGSFVMEVRTLEDVKRILKALRGLPSVISIEVDE
jgi:GTP pyrophosphokinase